MTTQTKNEELQRQIRRRTAERRSGRPVRLPPDKDKLARWQGDHAALLTRLQEKFGKLWEANDALGVGPKVLPAEDFLQVHKVISATVEHFGRKP